MLRNASLIFIGSWLWACGGGDNHADQQMNYLDAKVPDAGVMQCGLTVYPCAPYGRKVNDVVENMEFLGYSDPKEHCKEASVKSLALDRPVKLAFKDWFLGDPDPACANFKKSLLWVIVSAGWCDNCQTELAEISPKYSEGSYDRRLGILNVLVETETLDIPVDETFTKKWINAFQMKFPVAMDPTFSMGQFFSKAAMPFNMLVDLKTMKIVYMQTGGKLVDIVAEVDRFLSR